MTNNREITFTGCSIYTHDSKARNNGYHANNFVVCGNGVYHLSLPRYDQNSSRNFYLWPPCINDAHSLSMGLKRLHVCHLCVTHPIHMSLGAHFNFLRTRNMGPRLLRSTDLRMRSPHPCDKLKVIEMNNLITTVTHPLSYIGSYFLIARMKTIRSCSPCKPQERWTSWKYEQALYNSLWMHLEIMRIIIAAM